MNEKFNKNAKVEKITNMLGIAVRLFVIDPSMFTVIIFQYVSLNCIFPVQNSLHEKLTELRPPNIDVSMCLGVTHDEFDVIVTSFAKQVVLLVSQPSAADILIILGNLSQ